MQDPKPVPHEQCTHHVFLSITGNVLQIAKDTKEKLEKHGYRSWLYTDVFDDRLIEKIFNGIKKSVVFFALVTKDYVKSEYCMREIRTAGMLKKPIIPIVCEKFDIWPPEEIMMLVMDTIYIPLFNNKNQWDDDMFNHLLVRLPPADVIKVDFSRSRSPSVCNLTGNHATSDRSVSPAAKYLNVPAGRERRSRSKSRGSSSDEEKKQQHDHKSRSRKTHPPPILKRSPSQDVTLFHEIDNWPALKTSHNTNDSDL